jgi:hypothetical protein
MSNLYTGFRLNQNLECQSDVLTYFPKAKNNKQKTYKYLSYEKAQLWKSNQERVI